VGARALWLRVRTQSEPFLLVTWSWFTDYKLRITLSTTLRDTLRIPGAGAFPSPANVQERLSTPATGATHKTIDLGPDVGEVLDELCSSVKGLDKYSAITRDTIEDKDGMFLPGR
jgi:hypothetical protein